MIAENIKISNSQFLQATLIDNREDTKEAPIIVTEAGDIMNTT